MLNQPDVSDRVTDIQSLVNELDHGDYSYDSLNQVAKKLFNPDRVTLVSTGNLKTMPYLDDLKQ